ncbi:hypothetical protein DFQ28_001965, partial [Apophysomyces sp. BC1034]
MTAYRPQTLAKIVRDKDKRDVWDECLAAAVLAVRMMPNEATRHTPAMLLYGYELRTLAMWPAPRQDFVIGELKDEVASR